VDPFDADPARCQGFLILPCMGDFFPQLCSRQAPPILGNQLHRKNQAPDRFIPQVGHALDSHRRRIYHQSFIIPMILITDCYSVVFHNRILAATAGEGRRFVVEIIPKYAFIHSYIHSYIHSFLPSLLPCFLSSFLHSFSLLHSFSFLPLHPKKQLNYIR